MSILWLATGQGYPTTRERNEEARKLDEMFAKGLGKSLQRIGHEAAGTAINARAARALQDLALAVAHAHGKDPIPSPKTWQDTADAVLAPIHRLGLAHRPRRDLSIAITHIAEALIGLASAKEK